MWAPTACCPTVRCRPTARASCRCATSSPPGVTTCSATWRARRLRMLLLDRTFDVSTTPLTPAPSDPALAQEAAQFIGRESRLLDERRFDEWLGLWTDEGRYWMPRHHAQAEPFTQISLFWEDR